MYAIFETKQQVLQEIKTALGKTYSPSISDLETPPDREMGDISFPCFVLAKSMGRNPMEIATELAAKIGPKGVIKKVESKGAYLNFFLDYAQFGTMVLEQIAKQKEKYGLSTSGEKKSVMIEYANLNTHKDVHIGHLRNLFLGHAIVNAYRANGYETIPAYYINDLGAHVAACIWGIEEYAKDEEPEKEKRMSFLNDMYAKATAAAKESNQAKEEISLMHRSVEELAGPYLPLWKKTRKWSLEYLEEVYSELNLPIDIRYYESELIDETKKIIEDLIKKGIVTHSEGAWIVDLQEEGLGVNLLVKSDGTLLYNAKDLALAYRKEKEHRPHRSIIVVDNRQALAMKQLFTTLKKAGFSKDYAHLSYEHVTLKDGVISSRKGNVPRYEELRDTMLKAAKEETAKRHEDWSEKKLDAVAHAIAFGALRFTMLDQDPAKKIIFDVNQALSFEGRTAPYLLYTYARIASLLKKAGKEKPLFDTKALEDSKEHAIMKKLALYPDLVFQIAQTSNIASLATYLFELAQLYSEFYNDISILKEENEEKRKARLGLSSSVAQVLKNGLGILGIETIDEM